MTTRELNLEELTQIMRECAGEDEAVNLDGDILDVPFADLGYDSLALLEAASRIERHLDIKLADDALGEAETPRQLLAAVNTSASVAA
ncbi:acyl carrier protein [Streptomyces sp. NPDC050636]|uniref:acyl carrier protein n=1 Tax=Streptomyces sp. NPDC050636 TaxID=3154510 RepID=UPI003439E460